ncbi:hypothetical protein FOCC_FOCC002009 [Frankliniella occidentalis]|uniref:Uncharacterized protein LOC113213865 isoform X2 n=1 Tax=Frankliniella occidentalis TaxID=133901 RepID=A0A9C6U1U7_FRAOC|nr:uncharacterized protein LOC113213865 isoform X2 [Frankliniella occidentalis]XP_052119520.1 uncharacterized protein LOC113213865 isoform X2 [Frankliniella occidentalis]KAE8751181.1 hypothetical protein FOCC_FOCC002009 [Frankliniella occidentalis]
MKCLLVLSALTFVVLLAGSTKGEKRYSRKLTETVDGCLAFFDKTRDDLEHVIMNDTLDESSEFPAKMTLCVFRSFGIFDDEDRFSKIALVNYLSNEMFPEASKKDPKIAEAAASLADKCEPIVEASDKPALENAKILVNCLLAHKNEYDKVGKPVDSMYDVDAVSNHPLVPSK